MVTTVLGNQPTQFFVNSPQSNGVLAQLSSGGLMNAIQCAIPSMSYWRFRFLQYTQFALVDVTQNLDTQAYFGGVSRTRIVKVGDLMYYIYLMYQLPGIVACNRAVGQCGPPVRYPMANNPATSCGVMDGVVYSAYSNGAQGYYEQVYNCGGAYNCASGCDVVDAAPDVPYVHYVNAIAQFLTRMAMIQVGTCEVDTVYSDYLYMWEELSGKPGKYLNEMVGKWADKPDLIEASKCTTVYYCPLPFYFTMAPGNAMPLCSVLFSGVYLNVQFAPLEECIVVSGENVVPMKTDGTGQINNQDLRVAIETLQVVLEETERDRFIHAKFEQLITQVNPQLTQLNQQITTVDLSMQTCIIELIWGFRRRCHELSNNWFNYSGIGGRDPMVAASIQVGSAQRQPPREAGFYRLVQPYQYHTRIPDAYVYCYSFALYPEEIQPSSFFNAGRAEKLSMMVQLQPGLAQSEVNMILFARSWNIIQFARGGGRVLLAQ
jgi:hypothetical protein